MAKKTIFQKVGKSFATIALALLLAQGMIMLSSTSVTATEPTDGSCIADPTSVCGLNGQNYNDKIFDRG